MDFAVLIPVKGDCKFLTFTLESVCKSSITPKEVIIVDDGISESAIKVIESYHSELNITLLPNLGKGIVAALNTGLRHCSFPFIARLDSDDLVTPERFELQMIKMLSNPRIAALGGQVIFIDSKGQTTGRAKYESGRLDNSKKFRNQCLVAHPATMIRTSMAFEVSGYRTLCTDGQVDFAEDFDFWLRLSRIGEIHNLNEVVLLYRQHNGQVSRIHAQSQSFSTAYVSLVNQAESLNSDYKYKILVIRKFSVGFLLHLFKSIPSFQKIDGKLKVVAESLFIFFGITNGLVLRIIRRILKIIS